MKFVRYVAAVAALFLVGCGSNPMKVTEVTKVEAPASDQAQVVFMRSSFVGSAISSSLYDVTSGEPVFIGILNNGTKVPYVTSPGKHVFMVVAESADYMEANLEAGKTYYGMATPRMGAWKARFSLWPIKRSESAPYPLGSKEVESWIASTKLATLTEKANQWFVKNKANITAKHNKYWPTWLDNAPEDIAARTLDPEDGI